MKTKAVYFKEVKMNMKQLIIWSLTVGGLGLFCILLYQNMRGDIKEMADMFSDMGAFSDAFGMSTLSIATLEGYFATEVGTVHGLGSAMFAAIISVMILSKEEDKHTGEFLFSLPLSRNSILCAKGLCVLTMIAAFTVVCTIMYLAGFAWLNEDFEMGKFVIFMCMQLLMNIEIAAICFGISAVSGKINMGAGLSVALIFYVYDLIGRVVPDMKNYIFIGPYSYANAAEIFSGREYEPKAIALACAVIIIAVLSSAIIYNRRDI